MILYNNGHSFLYTSLPKAYDVVLLYCINQSASTQDHVPYSKTLVENCTDTYDVFEIIRMGDKMGQECGSDL